MIGEKRNICVIDAKQMSEDEGNVCAVDSKWI